MVDDVLDYEQLFDTVTTPFAVSTMSAEMLYRPVSVSIHRPSGIVRAKALLKYYLDAGSTSTADPSSFSAHFKFGAPMRIDRDAHWPFASCVKRLPEGPSVQVPAYKLAKANCISLRLLNKVLIFLLFRLPCAA